MKRQTFTLCLALCLSMVLGCDGDKGPGGSAQVCTQANALSGFESRFADVGGERVHYMIGGSGPALVLLHGWPAAWISWKKIMPALASAYTVIAVDLRGLGDSSIPADFQLDAPKAAENVFQVVQQLGHTRIYLVGHDWGGSVAYSYALAHREQVMKLAILESAPGQDFGALEAALPKTFWFNWFHQVADLPEELVAGKERVYLSWFYRNFAYRTDAIGADDINFYECTYSRPGGMRAGFEYYRDQESGATSQEALLVSGGKLQMPVLGMGGQYSLAGNVASIFGRVAEQVTSVVVPDAGHWVVEENPDFVRSQLESFLAGP
jgi:pimeloyl-ACP methyl ester carboxylesterase